MSFESIDYPDETLPDVIARNLSADQTEEPHPPMPAGPWARFGDCPECGSHRGFACVETDGHVLPGKLLGHAHQTRPLDPPSVALSADELYSVARDLCFSLNVNGRTWTDQEWLEYDDGLADAWESVRAAADRENAPAWAVFAAGEVSDKYRQYASDRRRRMARGAAL